MSAAAAFTLGLIRICSSRIQELTRKESIWGHAQAERARKINANFQTSKN